MKKLILIILCAFMLAGCTEDETLEADIQPTGSTRSPADEAELRAILEAAVLDAITPPTTMHPREERAIEDYEINKSEFIRLNLIASDIELNNIHGVSEDMLTVEKDGKYGFADKYGEIVIPFNYILTHGFSEGLAAVKNDKNKWGYIDRDGETVIPFIYDRAEGFSEGLAAAAIYDGRKAGYINAGGETVVPLIYDQVHSFNGGYAVVGRGIGNAVRYGIIDKTGETVVPCEYISMVYANHENLFIASKAGETQVYYGVIDAHNNIVVPFEYGLINQFYNGLAVFKNDAGVLYGVMNTRGEVAIPVNYLDFGRFSFQNSDVAFVLGGIQGGYALIDRNGGLLTDFVYSNADVFHEGLAGVYMGNTRGYIDESGEFVITGDYQGMGGFRKSGIAAVTIVGTDGTRNPYMTGLIDRAGKFVLPCVYISIKYIDDYIIAVQRYINGTWDIYEIEEILN